MGDFAWLTQDTQIRKKPSSQQAGGASAGPSSTAAAAAAAGANAGAGGSVSTAAPGRVRISLPSFKEVQAAQRPAAAPNIFQPGTLRLQQQQQQQVPPPPPNQQQQVQLVQQQPYNAGAGPPAQAAAAAAAAASLNRPDLPSGPSLGLNVSIPRYNQSSTAPGQAAVGAVRAPPTAPQPGLPSSSSSRGYQQQQPGSVQPGIDAVLVSNRQQGNPVLKHIKSVRWMFSDIVPDYTCGANTGVIFLSLRYHLLQPEYVLHRLKAVQRAYRLTVLLLLVDVEEVVKPLQELHKAAMGADATLICAFSNEECARYLETFKAYENRPASSIMEKTDTDYLGRLTSALTTVRGINRTDAYSLASKFGSLAEVMQADLEDFAAIPGLGPVKARRLVDVFSQPFKKTLTAGNGGKVRQQQQQGGSQQVASPPQQQGQQQQRRDSGGQLLDNGDQDVVDDEGLEDLPGDDQGLDEQGVDYEAPDGGLDGPNGEPDSQEAAAALEGFAAAGGGSERRAENAGDSEGYHFYDDQDDALLDEEF